MTKIDKQLQVLLSRLHARVCGCEFVVVEDVGGQGDQLYHSVVEPGPGAMRWW